MRVAHMVFKDLDLMWIVHDLEGNIMNELDFANEARNAEKAREIYGNLRWLKVPNI